jgi:hypothetical protein
LAQELQRVYPDLVYSDKNGILSVDYVSLIPVLVESIKELNNKHLTDSIIFGSIIAQLQNKINADSIYFESKLGILANQLSQCCRTSKLKSASINNTDESLTRNDLATLSQNAPNPFNKSTSIGYYLPQTVQTATLYVYDMNGVQIKSIPVTSKGKGSITINGNELRPGMYLYTLIADAQEVGTKRMILTQ